MSHTTVMDESCMNNARVMHESSYNEHACITTNYSYKQLSSTFSEYSSLETINECNSPDSNVSKCFALTTSRLFGSITAMLNPRPISDSRRLENQVWKIVRITECSFDYFQLFFYSLNFATLSRIFLQQLDLQN